MHDMELRGGNITLGELARDPRARALVDREFPGMLNHPMAGMFMGLTLNQAVRKAGGRVPQKTLRRLVEELKAL